MTRTDPPDRQRWRAVSQVTVAFSGGGGTLALARTAAVTARALDASVTGLYVRDTALQELAGLPFASTLSAERPTPERLTPETIERAWMRDETLCRAALAQVAEGAAWPFETVAGRLETILASRLARTTLLATDAAGNPGDAGLWAHTRRITDAAGAMLFVPGAATAGSRGPVLAIDDGDRAGAETISLAERIAQAGNRPLAVLALGPPGAIRAIEARARSLARSSPVAVHGWPDWRADEIGSAIASIAPWMIVGDLAGRPFAEPALAMRVLRHLAAPLILISPGAGNNAGENPDDGVR